MNTTHNESTDTLIDINDLEEEAELDDELCSEVWLPCSADTTPVNRSSRSRSQLRLPLTLNHSQGHRSKQPVK